MLLYIITATSTCFLFLLFGIAVPTLSLPGSVCFWGWSVVFRGNKNVTAAFWSKYAHLCLSFKKLRPLKLWLLLEDVLQFPQLFLFWCFHIPLLLSNCVGTIVFQCVYLFSLQHSFYYPLYSRLSDHKLL